jgi:hypothetical protein
VPATAEHHNATNDPCCKKSHDKRNGDSGAQRFAIHLERYVSEKNQTEDKQQEDNAEPENNHNAASPETREHARE